MKLQNLTVIFIIIILPIILLETMYINKGIKTIKYQALYDEGLINATHDAIYAFEINTQNNDYSDNPETKREILKSSIKLFEKGLCNTCGISEFKSSEIEEYIPAILFGLYDGFYIYAPSKTLEGTYEHSLKNYVYYSETLSDGTVITYSLDNYVTVTIKENNNYVTKDGYLMVLYDSSNDGKKYRDITINKESLNGVENTDAQEYYKDAYAFTDWFLNTVEVQNKKDSNNSEASWLNIGTLNDPEDINSAFSEHKREVIKTKIEEVLNSTISAYAKRTEEVYKMPKLTEEDWEKIYGNISMLSFFQGKQIGFTKYNGYCVLNSTNSKEYVNPNLMYFVDSTNRYHDIRCIENDENLTGYRIGDFNKQRIQKYQKDNILFYYEYKHRGEYACYDCINGKGNYFLQNSGTDIYTYISRLGNEKKDIKSSYWTSLGRERYKVKYEAQNGIQFDAYLVGYNYEDESDISQEVKWKNSWVSPVIGANKEIATPYPINDIKENWDKYNENDYQISGAYEKTGEYEVEVKDNDGNSKKISFEIKIDLLVPELTMKKNTDGTYTFTASDTGGSGLTGKLKLSNIGGTYEFDLENNCEFMLEGDDLDGLVGGENNFYVYDNAGNESQLVTITIDSNNKPKYEPTLSVKYTYINDMGTVVDYTPGTWINKDVTAYVSVSHGSFEDEIRLDGFTFNNSTQIWEKTFAATMKDNVEFKCKNEKNIEVNKEIKLNIKIDKTEPIIIYTEVINSATKMAELNIKATDSESGLKEKKLVVTYSDGTKKEFSDIDSDDNIYEHNFMMSDLCSGENKFTITDIGGNSKTISWTKPSKYPSVTLYDKNNTNLSIQVSEYEKYDNFKLNVKLPIINDAISYKIGIEKTTTDTTGILWWKEENTYPNGNFLRVLNTKTIDRNDYIEFNDININDGSFFDDPLDLKDNYYKVCYLDVIVTDKYGNQYVFNEVIKFAYNSSKNKIEVSSVWKPVEVDNNRRNAIINNMNRINSN